MGHMSCLTARDTETTLPVTGPAASRARAFTKDALAHWGLAEFQETAVLLVSELVGNVVRHARSREHGLRLRLRADVCWLRIEVFDTDPGLPRPRTPGEGDESGFGFVLIEALAAGWGVHQEPGGKTVWAELATRTAAAPDAGPLSPGRGCCATARPVPATASMTGSPSTPPGCAS
jgi:anti-sigma regulatory factor (Ser/Thr protein kinase)